MMRFVRSAFVIARRDFSATVLSKAFIFFLLAPLFPLLFGGVFVLFRRWAAFFTVLSVNSLLVFLHSWFGASLLDTVWGSPAALWVAGDPAEALKQIRLTLRQKPDFPEALYNLALFEQELVDDHKFDPREAAAAWQAYLKADPDPKSPWVEEFKTQHLSP